MLFIMHNLYNYIMFAKRLLEVKFSNIIVSKYFNIFFQYHLITHTNIHMFIFRNLFKDTVLR